MSTTQLPAEVEVAACHLRGIVGFKALILGHSEGGFPVPSDAWERRKEGGPRRRGGPEWLKGGSSCCSPTLSPDAHARSRSLGRLSPFLMKAEMLWSMTLMGMVL